MSVETFTSGGFIVGCFFAGMLLRFGCKFADFITDTYRWLFRTLKVHLQKPSK